MLIPEIFIASKDVILPLLCILFKVMLCNCLNPESWPCGPALKQEDEDRCQQLQRHHIIFKNLSFVVDTRLRNYVKDNRHLADFPYGRYSLGLPLMESYI